MEVEENISLRNYMPCTNGHEISPVSLLTNKIENFGKKFPHTGYVMLLFI